MAHSAERILGFYGRVSVGTSRARTPRASATVLDDLQEVRPTLFGSVPRIFEKAYAKIHSELEKQSPPRCSASSGGRTASAANGWRYVRMTERPVPPPPRGRSTPSPTALVFKQGPRRPSAGRVRIMITGAAPTAPEILEFFWAAGPPHLRGLRHDGGHGGHPHQPAWGR